MIDKIVPFVPNQKISAKLNEVKKRNIGTNFCDKENCSHYISLDADEVFKTKELKKAVELAYENEFDFSVCKMITYYHDLNTILFPPEEYYIPFIIKLDDRRFVKDYQMEFAMDCGRSIPYTKVKEFTRDEIQMHHFSFVMKDLERKLSTQPTTIRDTTKEKIIERFTIFKPGDKAITNNGYFETKQVKNEFVN